MKYKKFTVMLAALCFIIPNPAKTEEKDVRNKLLDVAKQSELLNSSQIVDLDGRLYLVAVGQSKIISTSQEGVLKAMKESKLLSETQLSKFINGTDITSNKLFIKTVTKEYENTGSVRKIVSIKKDKKFIRNIRNLSSGAIRNMFKVGKWKDKEKTIYYYATGLTIPEQ